MVDQRSVLRFGSPLLLWLVVLLEFAFGQGPTQPMTQFSERVTLLRLRSSLGLKSKDWPIKEDPCRVWNGIKCENGSVVGINISGFKRTRIGKQYPQFAVDPLANLTRLAYFNASSFSLPGTIPDWLGLRLLTLQVLDLSYCSIRGVVPGSLGTLTSLRSLNLSHNSLTGSIPSSLGQLLNLSELDFSRNFLTGFIPTSFRSLQNLSSIDISSNYISGPIPHDIRMLSKVRYLNFSNNGFSSSIPPQLGALENLVDLDLSSNSLSGSVPVDLGRLRNLKKMMIGDNLLSGSLPVNLFRALSRLQVLVMRENSFSGSLPDQCWSLPELQILDISTNNFTGLLPNSDIGTNQTQPELDISENMFYGNLTPVLRRFKVMNLSGNYFEGRVPDYVLAEDASLTSNCLQDKRHQKTSSECSSFYSQKSLVFDNFGRPNSTGPPPGKKSSSGLSHRTVVILTAVAGAVGLILIILVLLILVVLCIRKRGGATQGGNGVRPSPTMEASQPPRGMPPLDFSHLGNAYTYEQLLQATEVFKDVNLIKHGHSGDIFRGLLENGIPVVIKRIDLQENKNEGYTSELEFFSKVGGHQRLVPLLGHCLENENQKFLVYKYMRHGDLASSLYRKSDNEDESLQSLDWITRLKIALSAAEGLAYLHHECSPPLVHRDVQASSIFLDDKFEVRLGSLSETCAQGDAHQGRISRLLRFSQSSEAGSSGGAAMTATCAYDVYCFGKVLLELVTGKLGISSPDNAQAKEYLDEIMPFISSNEKELVTKILDPSLIVDEDLLEEVWAMAIIAKSCLNPKPSRRPLMRHILNALENPLRVVREENSGSSRLRANSSRWSWNAAIFGSWRQSLSDVAVVPPGVSKGEGGTSSGLRKSGSQGSGQNENSSSRRRQSNEIVPEPSYMEDV